MNRRRVLGVLLWAGLAAACDPGTNGRQAEAWTSLAAGNGFTCGALSGGATYCWGGNAAGQLGDGSTTVRLTPVASGGVLTFASLTTGGAHACGVASGGATYCWGAGSNGQLGVNDTTVAPLPNHSTPVAVAGGLTFASVTAGGGHSCGVTNSGAAYCWGYDIYGQLGDSSLFGQRNTPVAVVGGLTFAYLTAGFMHTCGLTASGAVYCWGLAGAALGDGQSHSICPGHGSFVDAPCSKSPVIVAGGLTFAHVSAGRTHTCGVSDAGTAYCWGENSSGQLGDGSTTQRPTPVAVAGGLTFSGLTAGEFHTCGLTSSGIAYCWGENANGQLGDGTTTRRSSPVAVADRLTFLFLTAGWAHTCGVTTDWTAYCWGDNASGELGDGLAINHLTPVAVANP